MNLFAQTFALLSLAALSACSDGASQTPATSASGFVGIWNLKVVDARSADLDKNYWWVIESDTKMSAIFATKDLSLCSTYSATPEATTGEYRLILQAYVTKASAVTEKKNGNGLTDTVRFTRAGANLIARAPEGPNTGNPGERAYELSVTTSATDLRTKYCQ